jgi:C1A family cysteine protease
MMQFAKAASVLGFQGFQPEQSAELQQKFAVHMVEQGLSFGTKEEYEFRFEIFKQKDQEINFINAQEDTFQLGHNQFSTMTDAEAEKWMGLGDLPMNLDVEQMTFEDSETNGGIDWRNNGGVNSVKNQGGCGSCWAFSANAATEHAYWRQHKQLLNLSEQQLVDCDPRSHGCQGGWYFWAWDYLKQHPQMLTSQYPYTGRDGSCRTGQGYARVTNYSQVSRNSVAAHKNALNSGVLSIALAAGNRYFQQYRSGILNTSACGSRIDHAVNMVGWGSEGGQDYWIVRNSWGSGWGDRGHIKLAAVDGVGICGSQQYSFIVNVQ